MWNSRKLSIDINSTSLPRHKAPARIQGKAVDHMKNAALLDMTDRRVPESSGTHQKVVLRMEHISEFATKLNILLFTVFLLLSISLLATIVRHRYTELHNENIDSNLEFNVGFSIAGMAILCGFSASFVYNLVVSVNSKKEWGPRRRKLVILTAFDLTVEFISVVSRILIAPPCKHAM